MKYFLRKCRFVKHIGQRTLSKKAGGGGLWGCWKAAVNSELFFEIVKREETVTEVKPFLIPAVAALRLAIVAGRIRTNELMPDIQHFSAYFIRACR